MKRPCPIKAPAVQLRRPTLLPLRAGAGVRRQRFSLSAFGGEGRGEVATAFPLHIGWGLELLGRQRKDLSHLGRGEKDCRNGKAGRPSERERRSQFAGGEGPLRAERAGASESLGRGEVAPLLPFPLSHLLPFLLLILLSSPSTPAAVFTTNLTLSETNFAYDGQDIVINGATVAIDGPHTFSSTLLIGRSVHIPSQSISLPRSEL